MKENNQIILYEGNPLEKIAASDIVLKQDKPLMKQKKFYLASDAVVGEYGVTGFVVVDNQPEKRWISYTEGDKTYVPWGDDPNIIEFAMWGISDNPARIAHYVSTDKGFKMIRYFILPPNVREFFKGNRFLGEPMIDKCACDETIPAEFDEEKVNPVYAFREGEERELIGGIIEHVSPRLEQIGKSKFSWENFGHHVYFSFHPWQMYKPIIEIGEESIVKAVRNFDGFLSRFDEKKKLQRRNLNIEGAQQYLGVLPQLE